MHKRRANFPGETISCPQCAAFAGVGFGAPWAEGQTRSVEVAVAYTARDGGMVWPPDYRRQIAARLREDLGVDLSTAGKRDTLRGRGGRARELRAELKRLAERDELLRVVPHRLQKQPSGLLLWILCGQVLWWLEHYYAARRHDPHHLLRVGAPHWLAKLAQPAERQLAVTPNRWPVVRAAAARAVVAGELRLNGRSMQRRLHDRRRLREERHESRRRAREGFLFLYAVASPTERQVVLDRLGFEECAATGEPEFCLRLRDENRIVYFRSRSASS